MSFFDSLHPAVSLIFFLGVIFCAAFFINPVITLSALLGGLIFLCILKGRRAFFKDFVFILILILFSAALNPLFSAEGSTVILILFGRPYTLESLLYGIQAGAMIGAVLCWFKCLSECFGSEKYLYLFSKALPKFSLILTIVFRYIPLIKEHIGKLRKAQKALGVKDNSLKNKLTLSMRIFGSAVAYSLESAVETGNSMKARGFGAANRTSYSLFRFSLRDAVFSGVFFGLAIFSAMGFAFKGIEFEYYPNLGGISADTLSVFSYLSFFVLCLMPAICEIKENLKWRYLRLRV